MSAPAPGSRSNASSGRNSSSAAGAHRRRKKGFASLLLGTWDNGKLTYRGRVGTGWDDDEHGAIQKALDTRARKTSPFENAPRDIAREARWVAPTLVGEVTFTEFTPDGVLRHPSFMGLRLDKKAEEVTLEMPSAPAAPEKRKASTKSKPSSAKAIAPIELTDEMGIKAAERLKVRLTHPDRVVYPGTGITKAQIIAYYEAVAERMLPTYCKASRFPWFAIRAAKARDRSFKSTTAAASRRPSRRFRSPRRTARKTSTCMSPTSRASSPACR